VQQHARADAEREEQDGERRSRPGADRRFSSSISSGGYENFSDWLRLHLDRELLRLAAAERRRAHTLLERSSLLSDFEDGERCRVGERGQSDAYIYYTIGYGRRRRRRQEDEDEDIAMGAKAKPPNVKRMKALFTSGLRSHRIFKHMYEILNIDKNKN